MVRHLRIYLEVPFAQYTHCCDSQYGFIGEVLKNTVRERRLPSLQLPLTATNG